MTDNYEAMRAEIRRLHNVCRAKSELLAESRKQLGIYRAFFAGKISEEREKEIDQLLINISESIS
jgi:hypothetical protein